MLTIFACRFLQSSSMSVPSFASAVTVGKPMSSEPTAALAVARGMTAVKPDAAPSLVSMTPMML